MRISVSNALGKCFQHQEATTAFLHDQTDSLSGLVDLNQVSQSHFGPIFCAPHELPAAVLAQGEQDPTTLGMLGFLMNVLFKQGSPGQIHLLGHMINTHQSQSGTIPWAIGVLPAGAKLMLNGVPQDGLTTSQSLNRLTAVSENMMHQALPSSRSIQHTTSPGVVTYIAGNILNDPDKRGALFLSQVVLHEASHAARLGKLVDWFERNKALTPENRHPIFDKVTVKNSSGEPKLDLRFVFAYLELAASQTTEGYFRDLSRDSTFRGPAIKGMASALHSANFYLLEHKQVLETYGIVQLDQPNPYQIEEIRRIRDQVVAMLD